MRGATRAQIRHFGARDIFPELAGQQHLTANWNLHLYAGPSCLSRVRHAVRVRLASHAILLTCAPCQPVRRTGNSAAGDLAAQRSGNEEAGHRLSPLGAGGRGLGS
jgi:hypothetical protein